MSPRKPVSPPKMVKGEKKTEQKKGTSSIDKRKHSRFFIELPLDYSRKGKKTDFGGMVQNASEGGMLVYLPEKIEVGETVKVEIYFPKGLELNTVEGTAKIVWADLAGKESWREHRYGLEFHSMPRGTIQKLRNLLKDLGDTHKS